MNRYILVLLPVPDAKTLVVLCSLQEAVTYKVKEDQATTVTDDFLVDQVAPGINRVMGRNLALLFVWALLWGAIGCLDRVPTRLRR